MTYDKLRRIVLKYWDTGKLPRGIHDISQVYEMMIKLRQG